MILVVSGAAAGRELKVLMVVWRLFVSWQGVGIALGCSSTCAGATYVLCVGLSVNDALLYGEFFVPPLVE